MKPMIPLIITITWYPDKELPYRATDGRDLQAAATTARGALEMIARMMPDEEEEENR